jgi:hypothetical protein
VVIVTDAPELRVGEKMSMYCSVCDEEVTFVWKKWSGEEFFGYPPTDEYGWECSACGGRVPAA